MISLAAKNQVAATCFFTKKMLNLELASPQNLHAETECYEVRWFSELGEIKFCGHGSLALRDLFWFSNKPLPLSKIEQPSERLLLAQILDCPIVHAVKVGTESDYFLVEVDGNIPLANRAFDLHTYAKKTNRALIVLQVIREREFDYCLRYFSPQYSLSEDAATGSANAIACHYLIERYGFHFLRGYQASTEGGCFVGRYQNTCLWLGGAVQPLL